MLMQLVIQMPDKGVTAINFTVTGFDVTDVLCSALDKTCDWNRIDNKNFHIVIYGGKRKLTNEDTISIKGYQTAREIKMVNVVASNADAEQVAIYNRYKMG